MDGATDDGPGARTLNPSGPHANDTGGSPPLAPAPSLPGPYSRTTFTRRPLAVVTASTACRSGSAGTFFR